MADFKLFTAKPRWVLHCNRCKTLEVFESFREAIRGMDTHARWWHIDTDWFNKVLKEGGGITDAY